MSPSLSAVSTVEPSLTGKRWVLPPQHRQHEGDLVASLAQERGVELAIPSWEHLTDPRALGDLPAAVERIHAAIARGEHIGIVGDYDADGITGVAQLVRFFRRHDVSPHIILPHRERHGYGLKRKFIDALKEAGTTLFITVDTGIGAVEEVVYARSQGMDVIVTDHHALREELPEAILVHPRVPTLHKNPHLSGSGVVFTLLRALEKEGWEGQNIDLALAAIGTVADVVPLVGENRTIVALGLRAMSEGTSDVPVFALARSIAREGETLTSAHIGFRIAPRINAAGRLADPMIALTAILDGGDALRTIHLLNEERQALTEKMLIEAELLIDATAPLLAITSLKFHLGVVGLIAGKLTEKYGRPSIVATERGGELTCSLRSIPGYHITEALSRCHMHLTSFGGHEAAGGCTLPPSSWEAFTAALRDDASRALGAISRSPLLQIDRIITEAHLSLGTARSLAALEPFGRGNPEPLFLLRSQMLHSPCCVGREKQHLQCHIGRVKAVGFQLGLLMAQLPEHVDVVCRLGINSWQGQEEPQIFIEDIAVAEELPLESVTLEACGEVA